jgi:predicted transposase YdaD
LFSELFLYLKQYNPISPWRVVTIYPSRRLERQQDDQLREILNLDRVTRIYLDELGDRAESSLGVGVVKLIIESEQAAIAKWQASPDRASPAVNRTNPTATPRSRSGRLRLIAFYNNL